MNAYNSERNKKITEKPNTPKRYNLIPNSKSKELIAVEVDSGRSAIFKAKALNLAMPCSIAYQLLIFVFFPTLSDWAPAGRHIAQTYQIVDYKSKSFGQNLLQK